MRVEVDSSGSPRSVHASAIPNGWTRGRGRKVLDQWFGAYYRYCKVKGADCALYILRLDENRSDWTLTMYASPEAQTLAPQSGVNIGVAECFPGAR